MRPGELGPEPPSSPSGRAGSVANRTVDAVVETIVSPFHCLYQDALFLHTLSHRRMAVPNPSEAGRFARAALLLYLDATEALFHQAALELARPELSALLRDPSRCVPLQDAWRLLAAISVEGLGCSGNLDSAPWPQFVELLALRTAWLYPGPAADRAAYYQSNGADGSFEPLEPHRIPRGFALSADRLHLPKTGLPRDPYALRPQHVDTARGVIDAAIDNLDRRLGGALTRGGRHRKEPARIVFSNDHHPNK